MAACRPVAWSVTDHAVERYRERVEPRLAPAGALTLLRELLPHATLLPEPTLSGQQRWLLPAGNAVVVAKLDLDIGAHVAVTVLGPHEMHDVDAVDDVVEAFRRATSARSTPTPMPAPRVRVVEVAPAARPAAPKPRRTPPPPPRAMPAPAPPGDLERLPGWARQRLTQAEAHGAAVDQKYEALRASHALLLTAHHRLLSQGQRDVPTPDPTTPGMPLSRDVRVLRDHAEQTTEDNSRLRRLLRTAVLALRELAPSSPFAVDALQAMESQRPGITGDHFCYPERFTKAERRAATEAAEAAAAKEQP